MGKFMTPGHIDNDYWVVWKVSCPAVLAYFWLSTYEMQNLNFVSYSVENQ